MMLQAGAAEDARCAAMPARAKRFSILDCVILDWLRSLRETARDHLDPLRPALLGVVAEEFCRDGEIEPLLLQRLARSVDYCMADALRSLYGTGEEAARISR